MNRRSALPQGQGHIFIIKTIQNKDRILAKKTAGCRK